MVVISDGSEGTAKFGSAASGYSKELRFFFELSNAVDIARTISTTTPAKAKVAKRDWLVVEIIRKVATTKIQRSETGIKTFQPNCMNWS